MKRYLVVVPKATTTFFAIVCITRVLKRTPQQRQILFINLVTSNFTSITIELDQQQQQQGRLQLHPKQQHYQINDSFKQLIQYRSMMYITADGLSVLLLMFYLTLFQGNEIMLILFIFSIANKTPMNCVVYMFNNHTKRHG